jgi:hypothetical protein
MRGKMERFHAKYSQEALCMDGLYPYSSGKRQARQKDYLQ